jgi:hypothetical protein
MAATGRCLCGAVRFTAEHVETDFHACHCGMCRRWAGGPVFAAVATGVAFEGEENIGRYASSDWAERAFCKRCGTNLFYFLKPKSLHAISVGTFDDPSPFRLVGEIYVDHQLPGFRFAGDLERLTEEQTIARFMGT